MMQSEETFRQWVETLAFQDIPASMVPEVCARLLAAEAKVDRVEALINQPDNPRFRMHNAEPFPRLFSRDEIRTALEGGDR